MKSNRVFFTIENPINSNKIDSILKYGCFDGSLVGVTDN